MSDQAVIPPDTSEAHMRLRWAFIFFLTMYAFMMVKAEWLSDPDTYWHIIVGRDMVMSGAVPRVDSYSFTEFGKPWIAKEWLSQLILYAAYLLGGWSGVAFLACTICALTLTLVFWRLLSIVKWTVAVGLVWISMPFMSLSFLARPQIFSFLLFAIAILEIEHAVHRLRPPRIFMIALAILWANLHASFPILLVLIAFGGLDAAVRAPAEMRLKLFAQWTGMGLVVLASFGITPYGFQSFHVATTIVGSDLSKYILEWRPIDWNYYRSSVTEALILGGWLGFLVVGSVLLLHRWRFWFVRAMPLFLFAALTIKHIRFCSMLTLVAATTVARPIADRFPRFAKQTLLATPQAMRHWKISLGLSLALFASTFAFIEREPVASITPKAALIYAKALGLEGRVYNSYAFGGFLIANRVPTLIDGRTELFLGGVLETVLDPIVDNDARSFAKSLTQFDVSWAIVKSGSKEAKLLDNQKGWRLSYQDQVAAVYILSD